MHKMFTWFEGNELNAILDREGVDKNPPKNANISSLHASSISLFRFILNSGDPRWRLAFTHARLLKEKKIKGIHLENALQANYLSSENKSWRNRYSAFVSKENISHLSRALKNNEIGHEFAAAIGEKTILENGYELKLEKTRNTSRKKDANNVSGCPEALWQLQLFKDGKYLGRVGFNFHKERRAKIISITNIQGAEGKQAQIKQAEKHLGTNFGAFLIKHVKNALGEEVVYRGRKQERNRTMYTMAFRKAGIKPGQIFS
ncbi:hypothetical protein HY993_04495 [Candidatus Micrarchaeota archaeon]|nr:hypothetical protein [Candidatus Micrarchaeota archaeon]